MPDIPSISPLSIPITANLPPSVIGGTAEFIGAINVPVSTIAFATTSQTGDYVTMELNKVTLTNPSSATITNATTLKILGPPLNGGNVTITNSNALWVLTGFTVLNKTNIQGTLTMMSANIALGTNALLFDSSYEFTVSNLVGIDTNITTLKNQANNLQSNMLILPTGTSVSSNLYLNRVSDLTNYELFQIGTDTNVTGEIAMSMVTGGTGSKLPINVYMNTTKLFSYDIAGTNTSYVTMNFPASIVNIGDSTLTNTYQISRDSTTGFLKMIGNQATTSGYLFEINGSTTALTINNSSNLLIGGKISSYNGIATAGIGAAAVYFNGFSASQTGAITVASYTTPASDGTYEIGANMDVTVLGSGGSVTVTINWTDPTNTAQSFSYPSIASIINQPLETETIRVKASTAITIKTSIAVSATYSVSAHGKQIA